MNPRNCHRAKGRIVRLGRLRELALRNVLEVSRQLMTRRDVEPRERRDSMEYVERGERIRRAWPRRDRRRIVADDVGQEREMDGDRGERYGQPPRAPTEEAPADRIHCVDVPAGPQQRLEQPRERSWAHSLDRRSDQAGSPSGEEDQRCIGMIAYIACCQLQQRRGVTRALRRDRVIAGGAGELRVRRRPIIGADHYPGHDGNAEWTEELDRDLRHDGCGLSQRQEGDPASGRPGSPEIVDRFLDEQTRMRRDDRRSVDRLEQRSVGRHGEDSMQNTPERW
jgi:hypothetical protein